MTNFQPNEAKSLQMLAQSMPKGGLGMVGRGATGGLAAGKVAAQENQAADAMNDFLAQNPEASMRDIGKQAIQVGSQTNNAELMAKGKEMVGAYTQSLQNTGLQQQNEARGMSLESQQQHKKAMSQVMKKAPALIAKLQTGEASAGEAAKRFINMYSANGGDPQMAIRALGQMLEGGQAQQQSEASVTESTANVGLKEKQTEAIGADMQMTQKQYELQAKQMLEDMYRWDQEFKFRQQMGEGELALNQNRLKEKKHQFNKAQKQRADQFEKELAMAAKQQKLSREELATRKEQFEKKLTEDARQFDARMDHLENKLAAQKEYNKARTGMAGGQDVFGEQYERQGINLPEQVRDNIEKETGNFASNLDILDASLVPMYGGSVQARANNFYKKSGLQDAGIPWSVEKQRSFETKVNNRGATHEQALREVLANELKEPVKVERSPSEQKKYAGALQDRLATKQYESAQKTGEKAVDSAARYNESDFDRPEWLDYELKPDDHRTEDLSFSLGYGRSFIPMKKSFKFKYVSNRIIKEAKERELSEPQTKRLLKKARDKFIRLMPKNKRPEPKVNVLHEIPNYGL